MDLLEAVEQSWTGLRRDLQIYAAAPELNGTESWVVEDPLNGKMYRFGAVEGALFLSLLKHQTITEAYRYIILTTAYRPSIPDAVQFVNSLVQSSLTNLSEFKPSVEENGPSFLQKLMHGYIYFRLPLVKPDAFLTHTYHLVEWLWSPWMRLLYFLLGVLGVLLSLQQISLMSDSVSHLFTPVGFMSFMLSLVVLKLGHEMAHGYTAKSHDLFIRSMGVAVILFWPVFYSDTTDAWKAKTNKVRFSISAAGVVFELVVAGVSLFFWAILADSLLREVFFYLATTSILSSVLVNLNPFMRFDGYYLLMDWWRIDNLQPRAFDLLKYRLRRLLVDWQGEIPEEHVQANRMVLYAIATSFYRVMIAVAIATAVYHIFSREIGLFLMVIELWVFLVQPIIREVSAVWSGRQFVGQWWHVAISMLCFVGLLLSLFIPFSKTEDIPAMLKYSNSKIIYASFTGRLDAFEMANNQLFKKGDTLIQMSNASLLKDYQDVALQVKQNQQKIAGLSSDGEEGGYKKWLLAESKRLNAQLLKAKESMGLLKIVAPYDGKITDINRDVLVGDYLAEDTYLLTYSPYKEIHVEAFLEERKMLSLQQLLSENSHIKGRIKLWNIHAPILEGKLTRIGSFPTRMESATVLFDVAGGSVASIESSGKRQAIDRYFMMRLNVQNPDDFPFHHNSPAWAWISFPAQSFASRILDWIAEIIYSS